MNQRYQDWSLIIIDDASSDNSFAICKTFEEKDSRIKVYRNEHNLGMVANWNKGISLSHGEYFIKLDADDVWHTSMLAQCLTIMESHPDVALLFTKYINIDVNSNVIPTSEIVLPEFAKDKSFSCVPLVKMGVNEMLRYPIMRQGLSLIRRKIFNEIGEYRYLLSKETQASSDTEFYFRVGCDHRIFCLDEVYYYYRIHPESISSLDQTRHYQQKKMYEVKWVINDYYFNNAKISKREWKKNRTHCLFDYRKHLAYQYRTDRKWVHAFYYFFRNMIMAPAKTISFYLTRI